MANEPKDEPISLADVFRLGNIRSASLDPQRKISILRSLLTGIPPAERSIAPLFQPPPVIQDRWFKDETIKIDGYTFERCRFDRCNLVSELATFTFRQCFISPDCGLFFVGPALKVARLLMHTLAVKARITRVAGEEAIYAPINPDGTFSLE